MEWSNEVKKGSGATKGWGDEYGPKKNPISHGTIVDVSAAVVTVHSSHAHTSVAVHCSPASVRIVCRVGRWQPQPSRLGRDFFYVRHKEGEQKTRKRGEGALEKTTSHCRMFVKVKGGTRRTKTLLIRCTCALEVYVRSRSTHLRNNRFNPVNLFI